MHQLSNNISPAFSPFSFRAPNMWLWRDFPSKGIILNAALHVTDSYVGHCLGKGLHVVRLERCLSSLVSPELSFGLTSLQHWFLYPWLQMYSSIYMFFFYIILFSVYFLLAATYPTSVTEGRCNSN